MYLEKLKLNGFKSFAQDVELKFVRGITAIVGPNGSGKSNIADAVRWVLGEQSMKSIRGKKSVDVIFAGSDKKARLGMAEVSLFFNNEDNSAPIDYSELVVTRRFYRSGEGEYLINNAKARLTDIQLLMAKANIGHRTYSVIGQGQIDAVLIATPTERKDFFDEATGVKQYQLKRDQALHKLERAYINMKQGKLMIGEMEPHLKMLTKQVRRLEQKELVEKELKAYQNYLYYHRWHKNILLQQEIKNKRDQINDQLLEQEKIITNLITQLKQEGLSASREEEYNKLQEEYEKLQNIKQEYQRQLAIYEGKKDLDIAQTKGHDVLWAKRKKEEIKEKIDQNQKQLASWQLKNQQLQETLKAKKQEQVNLVDEFKKIENKLLEVQDSNVLIVSAQEKLIDIIKQIKQRRNDWSKKTDLSKEDVVANLIQWEEILQNFVQEIVTAKDAQKNKQAIQYLKEALQQIIFSRDNLVNEINELILAEKVNETNISNIEQRLEELQLEWQQLEHIVASPGNQVEISAGEKSVKDEIAKINKKIEIVTKNLKEFNKTEQQKKEKLLAKQAELQFAQQNAQNLQQQIGDLTAQLARYDAKAEDLAIEAHRELGDYLAALVDMWKLNPPVLQDELTEDELVARIEQLKKRREMIGGIEPEAVAEYKTIKEKYDFLTAQVDDLAAAMTKLKDTIIELDEIISKQFSQNFKKIGELFNTYFRILFSGGRAELVLLTSDDEKNNEEEDNREETSLETDEVNQLDKELAEDELKKFYNSKKFIQGIEIKATPPGKKMKGIAMLSGGERALTSIALICAMIANNPSSFVVLDEVDAALDEANSLRFAEIISELSKHTQFIVITHNRATMEKADILYGTTMRADGVSDLLSVKFEEAQEYANRY